MEWSERLPLIWAIIGKDLRAARWWWVGGLVLAFSGAVFTTPTAIAIARINQPYGFPFRWYDLSLRGIYGLVALLTSLSLGLAFSSVYTGEVRRGTIRSIILYPVDADDVILAKLGSGFLVAFLFSFPTFLGFAGPFMFFGALPGGDLFAIYFMALFMGLVALATGVFLALILARYANRMVVNPSTMGGLFLLAAILLTEQVVSSIGVYLVSISRPPGTYITPGEMQGIADFARAISVLSPQHMGARILGDLFGVSNLWPDVHVVIPVFVVVVAGGYLLAKRLYMDRFVR